MLGERAGRRDKGHRRRSSAKLLSRVVVAKSQAKRSWRGKMVWLRAVVNCNSRHSRVFAGTKAGRLRLSPKDQEEPGAWRVRSGAREEIGRGRA